MSPDPAPRSRYAFAVAFLACFVLAELVYSQLDPAAQARLVAWASTNVANLEHEPVLPLLVSAFVAPGYFAAWPVLIALALFGANRALGSGRTALVCLAGHAPRRQPPGHAPRRQPPGQQRGTWLVRALVILVFPGDIFGGLSQLDVAAVGHLTALVTAAAATALMLRRQRRNLPTSGAVAEPALPAGISPHPRPPEDQAPT
jgi:hypothetical protein